MFVVMAPGAGEAEILGVKSAILGEGLTPYDHVANGRTVIAVGPLERQEPEEMRAVLETNLLGAMLGTRAVNETRFQFMRDTNNLFGNNSIPTINVLEAFTGGGSQVGNSYSNDTRWELQNYTSVARGAHGIKFGIRVRGATLDDYSPNNFGGTFTFAGGFAPTLDANLTVIRPVDTRDRFNEG